MRGGHAPADPRRGNGPVRPSPLPTSLFVYPRDESGLARSRRAEALRRESFCQRAQSATGRSAITSDDVDLSADDSAPSGSRLRLRCDKNGSPHHQHILVPHMDRSRRIADVADRGLGRLSWADSAPYRGTSGRTRMRTIAAIPLRAKWASPPEADISGGLPSGLSRRFVDVRRQDFAAPTPSKAHSDRRRANYSRTVPNESPRTRYFCSAKARITTGNAPSVAMAAMSPQRMS